MCVRALLAVMRSLPDHAIHQLNELRTTLFGLLQRCLVDGRPAQVCLGILRTGHKLSDMPLTHGLASGDGADSLCMSNGSSASLLHQTDGEGRDPDKQPNVCLPAGCP